MICSRSSLPTGDGDGPPQHVTMRQLVSVLLSTLLIGSSAVDAARSPRQQAEQGQPYAILPPGPVSGIGSGSLQEPHNLGELDFVCGPSKQIDTANSQCA